MEEEVLVFPTALLDRLGSFVGFNDRVDAYLPVILDPAHLSYLKRSLAEEDPTYKQLIPYAVLVSGSSVYCYSRGKKGGESRLHDLLSLGVGGHICREDGNRGIEAYEAGFARELDEEVEILGTYESRIVGLLHDPRTPVGNVHVGIVHLLELTSTGVVARDPALAGASFMSIEEVREKKDLFETWSQFVIDHVLCASPSVGQRP